MCKPINIYTYMLFYVGVYKPVLLMPKFTTRENKIRTIVSGPFLYQVQMKERRLRVHSRMCPKRNIAMVKPNCCCHRGLNLRI